MRISWRFSLIVALVAFSNNVHAFELMGKDTYSRGVGVRLMAGKGRKAVKALRAYLERAGSPKDKLTFEISQKKIGKVIPWGQDVSVTGDDAALSRLVTYLRGSENPEYRQLGDDISFTVGHIAAGSPGAF